MKKSVSLILALALCFSLIPCAFAAETVNASDKFTDVPANAWYLDELNYALADGCISGTSATTFAPDALITFEQVGAVLANYISKTGVKLKGYTASAEYKDASSISQWAAANMEVMPDCVHMLLPCPTTMSPSQIMQNLKGRSSRLLQEEFPGLKKRY